MSRFEKRLEELESRFPTNGDKPSVIWTILVSPDPAEVRESTYSVAILHQSYGKNERLIRGETETEAAFALRVEKHLQDKSIST